MRPVGNSVVTGTFCGIGEVACNGTKSNDKDHHYLGRVRVGIHG
jgi:hypothetical protein